MEVCRAMAVEPRLLLLDEPTRGLDYAAKQALAQLLQAWRDKGMAVLLVTHDPHVAAFGSRVMHLDKGELSEKATG